MNEGSSPNLSPDQFRRMMNIVFLEGVIQGLNRIKKQEAKALFKYDILIFKQQTTLTDLTGNFSSSELLHEMYRLTRD